MLKPIIPLVKDVLSHAFAEAIHESTIHAKYGKNHLQAEIATTGSETDSGKSGSTIKTEDVPFHIPCSETSFTFLSNLIDRKYPSLTKYKILTSFISNPAPPPKFV